MDVIEGVEETGRGGEALEVDGEGAVGDEVGAAGVVEAEPGLEGAIADGSLGAGGEGHFAAETGVATEEDAGGFAKGSVGPLSCEVDGDLAEGGGAAERAFDLEGAGVGGVGVGAGGVGLQAKVPLLGVGEPEGEVGFGESYGGLFLVELEVKAGAGGFNVGEARGCAGLALGGGGGGDVGGAEKDAFEVPLAVGGVDEVDAGLVEADGGEFYAPGPEGADAKGGSDGTGTDDRLGAEGGVFADNQIFKGEAGEREQIEGDAVEMDGAAEAVADAGSDAALEAVDADEGRDEQEYDDGQGHARDVEQAAAMVLGEMGSLLGVGLLVGWVDFLHRDSSACLFDAGMGRLWINPNALQSILVGRQIQGSLHWAA